MKCYRLTVLMYQDHSLGYGKRNSRSSMFRIVPKFKKEKAAKKTSPQSGRVVSTVVSDVPRLDRLLHVRSGCLLYRKDGRIKLNAHLRISAVLLSLAHTQTVTHVQIISVFIQLLALYNNYWTRCSFTHANSHHGYLSLCSSPPS